jgi:hAT family C-terminal dimerisation region
VRFPRLLRFLVESLDSQLAHDAESSFVSTRRAKYMPSTASAATSAASKREIDFYLQYVEGLPQCTWPQIDVDDPLAWWRLHQSTYPILSGLAHRFLLRQASSAASERVFSATNLALGQRRTSMKTDLVNAIVTGQKNLTTYHALTS